MSSRVQKGGQKFKPVVKPRGRPVEGSPAAPRKPLSVKGPTAEASAHNATQANKPRSQDVRLEPAPISAGVSASERGDPSVAVATHRSTSATRDSRTQKSLSSSSIGGVGRELSVPVSTIRSYVATDSTTNPLATLEADYSSAMPDASSPRPRHVPSIQVSRATSVVQQVQPATSSEMPVPGPTLHSLLHGIAPIENAPNGTLQSPQPAPTDVEGTTTNGNGRTEQQESVVVPDELPTNTSPLRLQNSSEAAHTEREPTDVGMISGDSQNSENRVRNRRRTSTRSRKTSDGPSSVTKERDDSERNLRRSNRRIRTITSETETQGQSDGSDTKNSGSESESEPRRKKRRRSTTTSTSTATRGRRPRNPVIFDPDAGPGEDLDPTVATMAAICNDTGQGRVSSKAAIIQLNHLAWKAANKQKREKMHAVMEAKKYGREYADDDMQAQSAKAETDSARREKESQTAESSNALAVEDATGHNFNYHQAHSVNRFSARVRLGPNGEAIVDEESLYVDRNENADEATANYQHVEESDQTKFTNSASYGRKLRGSRWSAEETELFYDALSQFGENYELISYVLPGRDRKSCKAKFKTEDKKNPGRITYCLNNRIPYDMQTLSRMTGRDFSGPTPEIKVPDIPESAGLPQQQHSEAELQTESDLPAGEVRKTSRTPNIPDDVEIVGNVETYEKGVFDEGKVP